MSLPKPSEVKKEGKIVLGWWKNLIDYIQKKRKLIILSIILNILLLASIGYLIYSNRIIFSFNSEEDLLSVNATATFYFDRQILKLNDSYNGELTIKTFENIPVVANLYFIPYTPNKIPPKVETDKDGCDFSQQKSCTIKFSVDTSIAQIGDFQICVLIRDKSNQKRTYQSCNNGVISLS